MATFRLIQILVALVIPALLYYWVWTRRANARYRRFCAETGCAQPTVVKNVLPGGVERLIENLWIRGDPLDFFVVRFFERYGNTHKFKTPTGIGIVVTAEPLNTQAVLALNFKDYAVGKIRQQSMVPLLGNGIFTSDGEVWEHHRALLRPQFSRTQVGDLDAAERHVAALFAALPVDASGWTSNVYLTAAFSRFTLDTSTEFLFGRSVESRSGSLADMDLTKFSRAKGGALGMPTIVHAAKTDVFGPDEMDFEQAFDLGPQYWTDLFRLHTTLYGLLGRRRFRAARDCIHDYVGQFVRDAIQTRKTDGDGGGDGGMPGRQSKSKYSLLEGMLADTQDPIELRSQLLHVLVGGRDTTASLLGWLFALLARHPDIFQKVRAEVVAAVGPGGSTEAMTFEKLKSLGYLQSLIRETMRLYPVVPMNARTAVRNTVLPVGGGPDGRRPIAVMKDDVVVFAPYVMHRRTDLWGADALDFKPERWEGRKIGWDYVPFNGGPRTCLGQQYALTEASFVIVRFCQRFDAIELWDRQDPIKKAFAIVMSPEDGVRVRLHRSGGP
ncbi:MAG: hypothetical protein M1826_005333 [Phylliscum demangeonii]|nr:MAG: hypothetical protein M1826_005333 [Phylliscum demangeonii]